MRAARSTFQRCDASDAMGNEQSGSDVLRAIGVAVRVDVGNGGKVGYGDRVNVGVGDGGVGTFASSMIVTEPSSRFAT